jgi:hypothetical protein
VVTFWVISIMLLVISIQRLRQPAEKGKSRYAFVIVGLLAFGYRVIVPSGPTAELSTVVLLICIVGLIVSSIRTAVQNRAPAASP